MRLRIAFDLDGVLADMTAALGMHADALFEQGTSRSPVADSDGSEAEQNDEEAALRPATLALTSSQRRRLWNHVRGIQNFWETLSELETGCVARLAAVATDHHWEVIFLTRRPESAGSTAQVQTQRWLQSKGFPFPSVFVLQGSRGRVASALALDVVVDDQLDNCLDVVADSKAKPILVWRDSTHPIPQNAQRLGITVVPSVAECLELLLKENPPPRRSSVFARAMDALGRRGNS
ncbi:MAG TPA: HAD family hydrolase [Vicinamibacterales bacterium]|jgi:hypothetical protein